MGLRDFHFNEKLNFYLDNNETLEDLSFVELKIEHFNKRVRVILGLPTAKVNLPKNWQSSAKHIAVECICFDISQLECSIDSLCQRSKIKLKLTLNQSGRYTVKITGDVTIKFDTSLATISKFIPFFN